MSKDRKILKFTGKYKKQMLRKTPNDLRAAAAVTVGFTLFIMIGFNFAMFQSKDFRQDEVNRGVRRGIASIPKAYEPQWRKRLSQIDSHIISNSSVKPSAIDKLNFGLLAGEYSMRIDRGHVTQIEFSNAQHTAPRQLKSREDFVNEYANVFVPGFQSIRKVASISNNDGTQEQYEVQSTQGLSHFEFKLDPQGRFLSLDVK